MKRIRVVHWKDPDYWYTFIIEPLCHITKDGKLIELHSFWDKSLYPMELRFNSRRNIISLIKRTFKLRKLYTFYDEYSQFSITDEFSIDEKE